MSKLALRFDQGRSLAVTKCERVEALTTPAGVPLDRAGLLIGITGHRDLDPQHEARLRSEFEAILDGLATAYPHTPLVVLSALATGADLLAAEVAFGKSLPVIACLPAAAAEYAADFTTPAERARFDAALKACARVVVASSSAEREQAYLEAGLYVAHYSHLLVAFWDGEPAKGRGGTADIVNVRMSGVPAGGESPENIAYSPEVGPVYQIVTPREGEKLPADAFASIRLFPKRFYDDEPSEHDFLASLARLEKYNEDLGSVDPGGAFPATIDGLRDRSGAASDRLQRATFGFLYLLYAVAIVATAAQYTSSQLFKYAMFPIAFGAYKIAQRFDYENRYQDYRALSEGLRVQSAWFGAGLHDEQADRSYLGMQQKELLWIRLALRYAYFVFRDASPGGSVRDAACQGWIDGQAAYFKTKPRREALWLRRLQLAARATLVIAVVVSVVAFSILYLPTLPQLIATQLATLAKLPFLAGAAEWLRSASSSAQSVQESWNRSGWIHAGWLGGVHDWDVGSGSTKAGSHHGWLVQLSTGVLTLYAAVALLISNYADKRGFAQNVKRYDRMFVVFDRAKRRLAAMHDPDSRAGREVVRELGRAALVENADWLLIRRERPLSFVFG